jgi:hypothetical protein
VLHHLALEVDDDGRRGLAGGLRDGLGRRTESP